MMIANPTYRNMFTRWKVKYDLLETLYRLKITDSPIHRDAVWNHIGIPPTV